MYSTTSSDKTHPCNWLKDMKRQFRLCRNDPALSEVLLSARNLSVQHCEDQFRYDRWNCSRKTSTFKRIFRETALLQAMAASAITYSVAKACAEGALKSCHCAKEPTRQIASQNWRWGGCGDNLNHGKKITRKFLQLRQRGDHVSDILRHDGEVGLQAVSETLVQACRCQGVSGSCTIKICWKRIAPFEQTARLLKEKYHEAIKVRTHNKLRRRFRRKEKENKLLFLSKSSTFCEVTSGRRCLNSSNCATLCCARGYNTREAMYTKLCNCRWENGCCANMKCDNCSFVQEEHYCKP